MKKWIFDNFDVKLKDLAPSVREKATEIANTLLINGEVEDQEKAIEEGIKQAEEWFLDSEG